MLHGFILAYLSNSDNSKNWKKKLNCFERLKLNQDMEILKLKLDNVYLALKIKY